MSFLDIRFPVGLSYGASGGPGYSTDVVEYGSGHESRNQNWVNGRFSADVARGCATDADRLELLAFFRVAKGRANSFRFQDPSDYNVLTGEGLLTQNSVGVYQLYKHYSNTAGSEDRDIKLPASGTVVVKAGASTLIESVDYSIVYTTGILTCIGSPIRIPTAWTGQFDVPCRFDTDSIRLVLEDLRFFKAQGIPIIEVKDLS